MRIRVIAAAFAVCATHIGIAQDTSSLRFEAATIKPNQLMSATPGGRGPDVFARVGITLRQLMIYAWDLPQYRIVGGPSWADVDRFDVLAKASAAATNPQMRMLVRELLADRFGLRTHRETRQEATYALTFARSDHRLGAGLKSAEVDCTPFVTGQRPMNESPKTRLDNGTEAPRCGVSTISMKGTTMTAHLNGYSIPRFADYLERTVNRAVIDRTGITTAFDIEFTFVNENLPLPAVGVGRGDSEGPSVSTALPEQLGLKFESARGPVEFLVLDSATHPSAN